MSSPELSNFQNSLKDGRVSDAVFWVINQAIQNTRHYGVNIANIPLYTSHSHLP